MVYEQVVYGPEAVDSVRGKRDVKIFFTNVSGKD